MAPRNRTGNKSMNRISLHEDLQRQDQVNAGTERSFGLVFAGVFVAIALLPVFNWHRPHLWALIVAAAFLAAALVAPRMLRVPNMIWFRFGLLLHKVVSPIILGLLFFVTVTPIAMIYRALGKDPLRLKFEPNSLSYWIVRNPPGPDPTLMTKQF
jgi:hypothetical protein